MMIDNGQIDEDHKQLLAIANRVLAMDHPNREAEELRQAIRELYEYVKYHFKNEEAFMRELNYPDLDSHHEKHRQIIKEMNYTLSHAHHMRDILNNFRELVNVWVIDHIRKEDRKIRKFIQKQN